MRIRAYPENRAYLDSINGHLGTALGLKNSTDDPAIIVFVPQKIKPKWLTSSQVLKEKLVIPGELECALDVVQGRSGDMFYPQQPDDTELSDRLRGWDDQLWPGSIVARWEDQSLHQHMYGTLGVFARRRGGDRALGFITNEHVAARPGKRIFHPVPWGRQIGLTREIVDFVAVKAWYDDSVDEPSTYVRADCAFVELSDQLDPTADINPQLMTTSVSADPNGNPVWGPPTRLGPIKEVSLDDDITSLIGLAVMRIGASTGPRFGWMVYFGFEFGDYEEETYYTDFLIAGADGVPFSIQGDSGSLIVTADEFRPIGLTWGGGQAKLWANAYPAPFTMGTDLSRILKALDLALVVDIASLREHTL